MNQPNLRAKIDTTEAELARLLAEWSALAGADDLTEGQQLRRDRLQRGIDTRRERLDRLRELHAAHMAVLHERAAEILGRPA